MGRGRMLTPVLRTARSSLRIVQLRWWGLLRWTPGALAACGPPMVCRWGSPSGGLSGTRASSPASAATMNSAAVISKFVSHEFLSSNREFCSRWRKNKEFFVFITLCWRRAANLNEDSRILSQFPAEMGRWTFPERKNFTEFSLRGWEHIKRARQVLKTCFLGSWQTNCICASRLLILCTCISYMDSKSHKEFGKIDNVQESSCPCGSAPAINIDKPVQAYQASITIFINKWATRLDKKLQSLFQSIIIMVQLCMVFCVRTGYHSN